MSDKAGSDLDVFDGLAAKKSRPSAAPAPRAPAAPPSSATRQKTLLGLAAPVAPGAAGARPPGPPPPPPTGSRPPAPPAPPQGSVSYEPPSKSSGGFPAPPPPPTPSSLGAPPPPPAPLAASGSAASPSSVSSGGPSSGPIAPPASSNPARTIGTKPPLDEDDKTPVPAKAEGKPGVDIDWDDEDEATMVFDKSVEDTARSLLHSAPPPSHALGSPSSPPSPPTPPPAAGAPPPSRLPTLSTRPGASAPPPTLPRAPLPPPPKALQAPYVAPIPPQQAIFEPPPVAAPSGGSRGLMIGVVVLLLAGAGAAAMFLMPKKGSMVLTVAGPGNKPIDTVEVYVDGAKKCEASPCRVVDLAAGTHLVKVTAAGYQPTADQAVKISNGDEAVQNIALTRASDGTGIRVSAEGRGIKLSVDGKEIGPLPQELKDLSPGDHLVHLDGGDRYESFEKHIVVEADQMQPVEPKLRVKKGLATIKLGDNADDAKVLLVSGAERRPLPQLPITVDISVDKPYSIVATKKGFTDFEQRVVFEDGQAERTFLVNLTAVGSEPAAPPPAAVVPRGGTAPAPAPAAPAAPKPASGNGTVNLNSIPASNVLLDGRPMGQTPRMNVSVAPGSHTVVFVNADYGRKAKTITVEAGKAATVTVRFP